MDSFDSYQDAAIDALDWVYSQYPISPNEWAGTVYKLENGKFIATDPREGGPDWSEPNQPPNLIKPDAYYHTHAQCTPDHVEDEFSDGFMQDKWKADFRERASYIETPGRMLKRYDPDPTLKENGKVTTLRSGCSCPGPIR